MATNDIPDVEFIRFADYLQAVQDEVGGKLTSDQIETAVLSWKMTHKELARKGVEIIDSGEQNE